MVIDFQKMFWGAWISPVACQLPYGGMNLNAMVGQLNHLNPNSNFINTQRKEKQHSHRKVGGNVLLYTILNLEIFSVQCIDVLSIKSWLPSILGMNMDQNERGAGDKNVCFVIDLLRLHICIPS